MKSIQLIFLIVFCHFEIISADSPLTSTNFSDAYLEVPIVTQASKANGQLTTELMSYIAYETNPIDIKVATINAVSWDHEAQNSEIFFTFLKEEKGYTDLVHFINSGTAADMLCYAYLKAMDNYFEVEDALNITELATRQEPNSFTFRIITALIKAQYLMDYDPCEVYRIPDEIRTDSTLQNDFNKEAVDIIFRYIDNYKTVCNEEKNPALILPKNLEGVVPTTGNDFWDKSQKSIKEKWEDVNNPIELTFKETSSEGAFHLYFTDSSGHIYDFNGNNNLGKIRLYGPASGVSNPYYVGKMFRITWEWKLSETWIFWDDWEKVIGLLPSIVNIELSEKY